MKSTEKCDQCGQPWLLCVCGYPARSASPDAAATRDGERG